MPDIKAPARDKPRKAVLNYEAHSEKACEFHNAWRTPLRIIAGAQGSGKSVACAAELLLQFHHNPIFIGKRALVVGISTPICRDQLLPMFRTIMTNHDKRGRPIGLIEGQDYEVSLAPTLKITFANGSEFIFLSLEATNAHKAWDVAALYVDELGLTTPDVWNDLTDRARTKLRDGAVNMMLATTNTYAPSHWMYQRYFHFFWDERIQPPDTYLATWSMYDNEHIKHKWKFIEANYSYSAVEFGRRIRGEWLSNEGVIYPQFERSIHLFTPEVKPWYADGEVVDPIKSLGFIGDSKVFAAIDFGSTQGTGVLWVGEYQNRYYVFDEYFNAANNATTATHSAEIKKRPYFVHRMYCDHNPELMNNYRALGHRNMEMAPKGANSIKQGIDVVARLLAENRLFISSRCTRLISEIENYQWDPKRPDSPLDRNICLVDALRYVLMPIAGGVRGELFAFMAGVDAPAPAPASPPPPPISESKLTDLFKSPVVGPRCVGMTADGRFIYESLA